MAGFGGFGLFGLVVVSHAGLGAFCLLAVFGVYRIKVWIMLFCGCCNMDFYYLGCWLIFLVVWVWLAVGGFSV